MKDQLFKSRLFKDKVVNVLGSYKNHDSFISLKDGIKLKVPDFSIKIIELLTKWRNRNCKAYPTQFKATKASTRNWLKKLVMEREDRILFLIEAHQREIIGHLGISNIDFKNRVCELDNVIRGVAGKYPGLMTKAVKTVVKFGFQVLSMKSFVLRVFSENIRAVKFYKRCGFCISRKIPLKKIIDNNIIRYEEIKNGSLDEADKIFIKMRIDKKR